MPDITVYGASLSPFVRKVLVIAAEKGICVDGQPVSPMDLPEDLRPHTPLGKIPFANIKGQWLADSSVISEYIEDLWPEPAFYPRDPVARARARWFEEYVDGGMIPRLGPTIVFQRLILPLVIGEPTDESIVQEAIANDLPGYLAYLESEIAGKEFYVGDSLSVADITVASFQATLAHAGVEADAAKYPNLVRHRDAMWARESFVNLIEGEKVFLGQLREQANATTA